MSAWRWHPSITEIGPERWSRIESPNFPFTDYEFLHALEASGSVGPGTGWEPLFLAHWNGNLVDAAAPLYLKFDSYGEYIFDWSWASAYERSGLAYYPKLVAAIPFTPATGPKLLTSANCPPDRRHELVRQILRQAKSLNLSSCHALFLEEAEQRCFDAHAFLRRSSCQFHWTNRDFADFAAFLASLRQKKRKEIRRERRQLASCGLRIDTHTGCQIQPLHLESMYRFYCDTTGRKWGTPYLTKQFFTTIGQTFRHRTVLHLAYEGEACVAGAIAFTKGDALFGRYWGASAHYPYLHFELCYYRGIDYAIQHGLARYEAGAQGAHKIQRGFSPVVTRSSHWIAHPQFREAVAHFLSEEQTCIIEELNDCPDAYK